MVEKNPLIYKMTYKEVMLARIQSIGLGVAFGMYAIIAMAQLGILAKTLPFVTSGAKQSMELMQLALFLGFFMSGLALALNRNFRKIRRRAIKEHDF